jgi:hydroxypyruvate reductase
MITLDRLNEIAEGFAAAVLRAADPARAVRHAWAGALDSADRVILLATGKASAPMTEAALDRIGPRLVAGAVSCVPDHEQRLLDHIGRHAFPIRVCPADHPLPTGRNLLAADTIAATASAAGEGDAVLVLVSGGASAHLTAPAAGLTLDELRALTGSLLRAGATINELNAVRKHLERLKGGGLARLIHPARADVLVLSDVLGDPLDTIGSGPTAPDHSTFDQAARVLERFNLREAHPAAWNRLERGRRGEIPETPKPGDPVFARLTHTVIANNRAAIDAAVEHARALGLRVVQVRDAVQGEAAEVGRDLARALAAVPPDQRPACVVLGGETTVTVGEATGVGGRNQELALAAAIALESIPGAAVITLATDGVDGPTDAAGAVVHSGTVPALRKAGVDPHEALARHDSHTALDAVASLRRTGPTGTNINDIAIGLVW